MNDHQPTFRPLLWLRKPCRSSENRVTRDAVPYLNKENSI